jgi:ABC-type antimicrobial peptide transport system permease subunit
MRFLTRLLRQSLHALRRHPLRSGLTTLGIVIGIAAVIAMVEISQGSATAVQRTLASMGANMLVVQPGAANPGGVRQGAGSVVTLTDHDAEAMLEECPAVRSVAPYVWARTQVVHGDRNWVPIYLYGTTPSYLEVRNWQDLDEGEAFTDDDVRHGSRVCLLGQTLVRELFDGASPVGQEVRLQNVSFRVIGVLARKGPNMFGIDQDDIVLAPWTTIKYRVVNTSLVEANQSVLNPIDAAQKVNSLNQLYPNLAGPATWYPLLAASEAADTPQPLRLGNVNRILVSARTPEEMPDAMRQIEDLLRERHHLGPGEEDDFRIRDTTEMSRALAATSYRMTSLLLAVATISLAVGGVGIMNIMLVSVTERTREIGLRMAVGARARDILRQFLAEATLLCFLGGAVGIGVGRGSSLLVHTVLGWPTETSLPAMLAALAVAVGVGLVFGYYPAWKASRLDPIAALRFE